jgi:anti-anti-sigma regulatory factor
MQPPPEIPRQPAAADSDALVILLTESLTLESVRLMADRVRRVAATRRVVMDVTGVPSFDSEGTGELLTLQAEVGADRLVVIGLREASARLVGSADLSLEHTPVDLAGSIRLRKLPGLVMVAFDEAPTAGALEQAVDAAIAADDAIVVVDMAALPDPLPALVDVLGFASSKAAIHGQELVLLNVSTGAEVALRQIGLAPTTYLASAT